MASLGRAAAVETGALLGLLIAVVLIKFLTGSINTKRLLYSKEISGPSQVSSVRIQLLVSTLAGAATYLGEAIELAPKHQLPLVPRELLILVGGSQVLYLGGKAYSRVPWRQLVSGLLGGIR